MKDSEAAMYNEVKMEFLNYEGWRSLENILMIL